ncbi:EAL domain-containing protein [Pseudomonas gessardii]|uniref:EAL domain-containing protein n=1 Tax=Pseudomonas gessardii TaxID=78544 RepID=A0ABS9FCM2_9PSED|nr:EAL domain-containing response regulator [Pseudomonas gessardii]MCF4980857.1 EAL domain-containing protein [Pseudomonas gessardii]MCF4991202.1 EAL domain-containing protein [Pseudomonas gessardii]MCF5086126.1 EAL domain-containing protein [Pseudomonas gessardii]MCF5097668.1 EAL domain-containing protein [Pseudomonas gessardii]MCF5109483.1 EAL domain-containing protein [Pseudomonas gessardii]
MSFLPIRVLVVEEHPFKQLVATQVFKDSGCEWVMGVADVAAALAVLERTGPVDIVLCPLKEHGVQGLTNLEVLSRTRRVKSIILCSARSQDLHEAIERLIGLLGSSLLGYVDTPVRAGAIAALLTRYLETTVAAGHPVSRQVRYGHASKACLERAITQHELKAFFQPKFNLMTGEASSFEVLARWEHPQYGVLCPADFLAQARRFGLMDKLLFAQLEQALAFLKAAREQGHELSLALNLEAGQLAHESLLPRLCEALERYAIPASRLSFEITESGLLEISPGVLDTLIRLRMMGVGLAIDDFGIGYSSLERLCQLPFTEIKLDARFARDLKTSTRNRAAISSTLALGEALGMAVVVEGVEYESQRQRLLKLGCKLGQGYLCARPMGAVRALAWLEMKSASRSTR